MNKLRKLLLYLSIRLKTNNKFHINEIEIEKFKIQNRDSLSKVPTWIDNEAMDRSYFNYGIPPYVLPLIDLEIGDKISYSDVIAHYSSKFESQISYLELGVSVGKNFFQLINAFKNAELTGFDIENINPVLEKFLKPINKSSFKLNISSLRAEQALFDQYKYSSNKVNYLAGDIFDESCWEKLTGKKFNIIFSDALHDPKALLFEYEMIKKYDLLDSQFMIFWDDLNHGLEKSFLEIFTDLKKQYNLTREDIFLVKINGWLGQNEKKHDVGLITNRKLK